MTEREPGVTPPGHSAQQGFTSSMRSAEHGFTLVEVMIALFVFGLIAAAGVALLAMSVRAQAGGGRKLDDVAALDRTVSILASDAAQAVVRPTRDARGTMVPAFAGEAGSDAVPMLRLVRAGWSNLDAQPRPGLQKVEYRVANGALERIAYPQLDGADPLPPAVLLPHVRLARLRYRWRGAWSDRWDGAGGVPLPQALELTLTRDDGTQVTELVQVGSGYVPGAVAATPGAPAQQPGQPQPPGGALAPR